MSNMTEENKTEEISQEATVEQTPQVVDEIVEEKKPARKSNFRLQKQYSRELTDAEKQRQEEIVFMPSGTESETRESLDKVDKKEISTTQAGRLWVGAVAGGAETLVYDEGFVPTALREDADYVQGVESEAGILAGSTPTFKAKEGTKFSGEKARVRVRQSLGLGGVFSIPLWHSGFWIRFKAPPEGELLELYRQITSDKTSLGRATYGLVFSNNISYQVKALADFLTENLYDTSLQLSEEENILDYISVLDIPSFVWGMACAIWPNGFQYIRGCINDPSKCTNVVQAKLDLSVLQMTNQALLSAKQRAHMTKRQKASMTKDSVQAYREEFTVGITREVTIADNIKLTLGVPSVLDHIESGYRWVSSIEEKYSRALTQDENKRDAYLIAQGKATLLRQYSHFVETLIVDGEEYDEVETVEDILGDITSDDDIRNSILKAVKDYINHSQVSFIAIPAFNCPACGQFQGDRDSKYPDLIPIDPINVFFTLTVQKVQRVSER